MVKLSILIPSLRPKKLATLIHTIRQKTFVVYEIICIVKDKASFFADEEGNIFEHRIKVIEDLYLTGTTMAIRQGLEHATGEYVVTLSDDCEVGLYWADWMIRDMEEESILNPEIPLIGNFVVFDKKDRPSPIGEMPHIGYFGKQFSMFPIIKQSDIMKIGGYYSTEFNAFYSDPDLGIRLARNCGKIVNSQTARIFHPYNPDALHLYNKSEYFQKDEEIFKKKWSHLGEFKGCEVIK